MLLFFTRLKKGNYFLTSMRFFPENFLQDAATFFMSFLSKILQTPNFFFNFANATKRKI